MDDSRRARHPRSKVKIKGKLLTGYTLKNERVFPLDEHSQFNSYKGTDEAGFISKVRETAMESS
jgi:hypothetical protein